MKYKKYPSYKDSGVEWLGKVPEHWELKAIKNVVKLQGGFAFKSEEFIDEGTPIIRIGDIQNNILFENCKKIKNSYELSCIYEIKKFDTLIALSGATTGKTCFVENNIQKSFINQRVARLPYKNKFIYFILNSDLFQKNILLTADGSAQDNISNSQIENMKFSLPSIKEQQQIANFLDKATAKIDTLIEKQTKQIELLKEKRQAVISHAVTKGINPNVLMKDSGVEWLGEIPEHWTRKKLDNIAMQYKNSFVDGPFGSDLKSNEYKTSGTPLIQLNNIKEGSHILENMKYINEEKKNN